MLFPYICPEMKKGTSLFFKLSRFFCVLTIMLWALAGRASVAGTPWAHKSSVPDSIMRQLFFYAPFYANIVEEYKAKVYIKGRLQVHKQNKLIKVVPSMFRLKKGVNDYVIESLANLHYTAPSIYDRKIIAASSTLAREGGQLTDAVDFMKMNIYAPLLLGDKLLSPLDRKASKHYRYLMDSVVVNRDGINQYKIRIIPKFRSTQLVKGYIWVTSQVWTIRELYLEGRYELVKFKMHFQMGKDKEEEFLPVRFDLNVNFKFLRNHLEMDYTGWTQYNEIVLGDGKAPLPGTFKKSKFDLTESYTLSNDTSRMITDRAYFNRIRPIPLLPKEKELYEASAPDTVKVVKKEEKKSRRSKNLAFWGSLGDALISDYRIDMSNVGTVKCSPLINPLYLDYSPSRGFSYKQVFKYNKLFADDRWLRITPQVGYNFTKKELYGKMDLSYLYSPKHNAWFEVNVGNGNRIYSSVVLDQLKVPKDSLVNFDALDLDYFKDVYFNFFHNIEVINGLRLYTGISCHWRYIVNKNAISLLPGNVLDGTRPLRSTYNSFAPRVRIEWTPGMYYYMNRRRKMNVGSYYPTFIVDYERGIKGVFNNDCEYERLELNMEHSIKMGGVRRLSYHLGCGFFTNQRDLYFVDYVNFANRNLPQSWVDEIGGSFHLLDRRWYNASDHYVRGNCTYEAPFILFRPFNRWLEMIQHERIYAGMVFLPHLNPYIEVGYGVGTHIFDVGVFVGNEKGRFSSVGCKFTFELFND